MAAFETLLKVPAIHAIEMLFDPDDGSVILAQRASQHGPRMVVQIPAHAITAVAQALTLASKANGEE